MPTAKRVPKEDYNIELTLSIKEARVLVAILNRIAGNPDGNKGIARSINNELRKAMFGNITYRKIEEVKKEGVIKLL